MNTYSQQNKKTSAELWFSADPWFNGSIVIASIVLFIGLLLVFPEPLDVVVTVVIAIVLLGLILNTFLIRIPAGFLVCSGMFVYQIVKLIQLLEENDGRVCLACRHVLGPQALNEYKCPECGKPVVDQEHP